MGYLNTYMASLLSWRLAEAQDYFCEHDHSSSETSYILKSSHDPRTEAVFAIYLDSFFVLYGTQ